MIAGRNFELVECERFECVGHFVFGLRSVYSLKVEANSTMLIIIPRCLVKVLVVVQLVY